MYVHEVHYRKQVSLSRGSSLHIPTSSRGESGRSCLSAAKQQVMRSDKQILPVRWLPFCGRGEAGRRRFPLEEWSMSAEAVLHGPNDHDSDRHISETLEMATISSAATTDRTPIAVFVRAEYSRNVGSSNGEVETWRPNAGPWSVRESSARPWRARSS